MTTTTYGRLALIGAATLFSTGGPAIKLTSLTGAQVAGFRSGLAALVLYLLVPRWRNLAQPGALRVGMAYAATLVLFVLASKWTTAANAIFLQSTAPLWVVLLSSRLLGEPARRGDVGFGAVLAAGLVLVVAGTEPATQLAPHPAWGNTAGILAGLAWALMLLGLRGLARDAPSQGSDAAGCAVVVGNLLAFGCCLPFVFPIDEVRVIDAGAIAYLGVFQIGAAYLLLTAGMRRVRAIDASLLLLIEPVLNALLTWALLGEAPGPWALAGCGVILGATIVRNLSTLGTGQ